MLNITYPQKKDQSETTKDIADCAKIKHHRAKKQIKDRRLASMMIGVKEIYATKNKPKHAR